MIVLYITDAYYNIITHTYMHIQVEFFPNLSSVHYEPEKLACKC